MELKIEFVNNTPVGEENELIEVHINGESNTNYPYCIKKGTFNYFGYNGDKQLIYSRNLEVVKDAIIKDIEEQFSEETYYKNREEFFKDFKPEIIEVTTKEQFDFLYKNWAMTWEGLIEEDFVRAMREAGDIGVKGYRITGEQMNKRYNLRGSNAYQKDLNIFAIYPYNPFKGIAMMYGARWFTDIVDNNDRRRNK